MNRETSSAAPASPAEITEPAWRSNWVNQLFRTEIGSPLLPAEFVAGQGPAVRLIDVREPQDFIGPLGYIPGSDWIPPERLESLPERLGPDSPLVVVSRLGEKASEVARTLERRGMHYVAALLGGVSQWLSLGFSTTRDPSILDRCDLLRPIEPPAPAVSAAPNLSIEQVENHLGDPLSVRWIRLAALVLHAHMSCIDGRDDRGVVGTPGGDAGQFVLALAAIESVLQRPLDSTLIGALLQRRIESLGGFYLHTDHHAAEAAAQSMRDDPRLAAAVAEYDDPREWRQFLRRPPLLLREAVLDHLCTPGAIGCGHLRLMHKFDTDYQVRPGLVLDFLRAFFHAHWEGAFRAEYELLQGRHDERAVLNTRVEGKLQAFSPIPLVSPSAFGRQMFVSHPQASQYLLHMLVDCLLLQSDLIPEFTSQDVRPILLIEIEALRAVHVSNSLSHLARGLPIYDVVFTPGGEVRVAPAGQVG
jgi:rhodanese-related sulfurtransferase